MLRFFRVLLICSLALLFTGAKKRAVPLPASIDRAIAESKQFASGFLGVRVVRLSDGRVLYQRNQDRLFTPASNTKLFTTALALNRLGPDYRFTTTVVREGPDLVLVGGGDPSLSARAYPYNKDASHDNPLKGIEDLADQIVGHGLTAVTGDVVGDDTRYAWVPYPGGWSMDDGLWEYGAPVSALIVNDNSLDLTFAPGESEGDPPSLTVSPGFEFLSIENRLATVAPGGPRKIQVDGHPGTAELRIWGTLPAGSPEAVEQLALSDPAVFAAAALRDALVRRGVDVQGRAIARHRFPDQPPAPPPAGAELARRVSPPLAELAQVVDKVSQNLHAEALLREVGAVRRENGTAEAGLAELSDFLTAAGIADDQFRFADGSGLSRTNLVTPQATVKLLTFMAASPQGDQWRAMLPIGGEDGTLKRRFKGHPEAHDIHAKTGSLSHVRALSGYADSKRNGRVAFSMMLNNYAATDAEVARFLDMIGLKLLP